MKGVDIVDIEVDIYIDNIDRTGEGTKERESHTAVCSTYLQNTWLRFALRGSLRDVWVLMYVVYFFNCTPVYRVIIYRCVSLATV
jgi:hypothetical protein